MKGCSHKEFKKESLSTIDHSNKHSMQLRMKYFTCLRKTDWKTAPWAHTLPYCHLEMCTLCFLVPYVLRWHGLGR